MLHRQPPKTSCTNPKQRMHTCSPPRTMNSMLLLQTITFQGASVLPVLLSLELSPDDTFLSRQASPLFGSRPAFVHFSSLRAATTPCSWVLHLSVPAKDPVSWSGWSAPSGRCLPACDSVEIHGVFPSQCTVLSAKSLVLWAEQHAKGRSPARSGVHTSCDNWAGHRRTGAR